MTLLKPLERWLINGVLVTIPLVITVMVLLLVINFLINALTPIVDGVALIWADEPSPAFIRVTTLLSLIVFLLVVGIIAEYTPGSPVTKRVDRLMSTIPVVSTIYAGAQQASELLVEDSSEQFQDVKLVEFPIEGSYILGFVTATAPERVISAVDAAAMTTVMIPLAPNPATNGIILHLRQDRLIDVEMTVDEAIQAIMTLGMAMGEQEPR